MKNSASFHLQLTHPLSFVVGFNLPFTPPPGPSRWRLAALSFKTNKRIIILAAAQCLCSVKPCQRCARLGEGKLQAGAPVRAPRKPSTAKKKTRLTLNKFNVVESQHAAEAVAPCPVLSSHRRAVKEASQTVMTNMWEHLAEACTRQYNTISPP